jgi:membrane-associated phospholipid phosphatase
MPRRLFPILLFLLGSAAFAAIAADVTHHGALYQLDRQLAPHLHQNSHPALVFLASAFSGLGDFRILAPFALAIAYYLYHRRARRELFTWAVGLVGSPVLCLTFKWIFAIPRPGRFTFYAFDPDAGYTFPSGHTMGAAIAAGVVVLLWMRLAPRPALHRLAAAALAALLSTLTAASLVYLGVHYLSDVLAGLALSLAWLSLLRLAFPPYGLSNGAVQ